MKRNRLIIAFCFIWSVFTLSSQTPISNVDSVFTALFDADLNPKTVSCSTLFSKPTVIISNVNCIACTEYFTKAKNNFHFVFIITNESLGEINRILAYHHLKKKEAYFTTCKYIKNFKSALCGNPTPCMAYQRENRFYFLNYSELNNTTHEFSLKMSLLKKNLR